MTSGNEHAKLDIRRADSMITITRETRESVTARLGDNVRSGETDLIATAHRGTKGWVVEAAYPSDRASGPIVGKTEAVAELKRMAREILAEAMNADLVDAEADEIAAAVDMVRQHGVSLPEDPNVWDAAERRLVRQARKLQNPPAGTNPLRAQRELAGFKKRCFEHSRR